MRLVVCLAVAGCSSVQPAPRVQPSPPPIAAAPADAPAAARDYFLDAPVPAAREAAFASLTGTADLSSGFDDPTFYARLLDAKPSAIRADGWTTIGRQGEAGRGTPAPALLTFGTPSAFGELPEAIVRRALRRSRPRLERCYLRALVGDPAFTGTVQATFVIEHDGSVSTSKVSGVDPDVAGCVADVTRHLAFPPVATFVVHVSYSVTFRPPP